MHRENSICVSNADSAFSKINNFSIRESKKCTNAIVSLGQVALRTHEQVSAACLPDLTTGAVEMIGLQHMPFSGQLSVSETELSLTSNTLSSFTVLAAIQ